MESRKGSSPAAARRIAGRLWIAVASCPPGRAQRGSVARARDKDCHRVGQGRMTSFGRNGYWKKCSSLKGKTARPP
eukprot:scaffold194_cov277-Pinguiococcus_pyrenoidosus.AAC.16